MNIFTKPCADCGETIFGPRLHGKARGQWLGYDTCTDCRAIAIEAQRAATENTGAVHESADPKGIAQ